MGGVINIITKRGTTTPSASFEFGGGSDSLTREPFAFSGAAKGLDLALGVGNYERSDITASGGRRWYHTGVDHNTNVNVDAGYSIDGNNRVSVAYNFGDIEWVGDASDPPLSTSADVRRGVALVTLVGLAVSAVAVGVLWVPR
ncbi:MAG: hypothetical protein IT184_07425 [Acidobacteria bacterium]|nr:hypothetical protein [Acidobacteriota bacterium]